MLNIAKDAGIAILAVNAPPVNAITRQVRQALFEAFDELEGDKDISKVILLCEGRTFFSGGDIKEFDAPPPEPHLPDVVQKIENSSKITIAAMHGICFGGGYEIAMACDYRVCVKDTKFAFPEVNLGLIPGAGGTQRLPRLIGLKPAAKMLASGAVVEADDMYRLGGIDKIIPWSVKDNGLLFAKQDMIKPLPVSQRKVNSDDISDLYDKYKTDFEAPHLNLGAAQWTLNERYDEAQPKERKLHLELRQSVQSQALRHVFFAKNKASKPTFLKNVTPRTCKEIAVIGGGLMGCGIAAASLIAGKRVQIIERDDQSTKIALDDVTKILKSADKRGKLTVPYDEVYAKLSVHSSMSAIASADLIIEAVFEDVDVKKNVFASVEKYAKSNAIITTNTSYLDPEVILPQELHSRGAGLHFFSPAHIMKLIEIVRLDQTSTQVLADLFHFARSLKKQPVLSGICDGFIGNRILATYRRQADYLLADGALPDDIDAAMRAFGMPMGPYEVQDMSGLQIAWVNRKRQAPHRQPNERYVTIADHLCENERFGKRSNAGWYDYNEKQKSASAYVQKVITDYSKDNNIVRQSFQTEDMQWRLLAAMANEGFLIVEEGIVESAGDVDVVKIDGYGFPSWKGGLLHYAALNLQKMKAAIDVVCRQSPHSWKIAQALK